jgi:hypothetical protein
MFSYPPLNEQEAADKKGFPRLPDGWYDFHVTESKPKTSTNGNPMINIILNIIHQGEEYKVWDSLIGTENMAWKTLHFCETTGLEEEYKTQKFNEKYCAGKRGKAYITTQPERPNPQGGVFKARNIVEDYYGKRAQEELKIDGDPDLNDPMPF